MNKIVVRHRRIDEIDFDVIKDDLSDEINITKYILYDLFNEDINFDDFINSDLYINYFYAKSENEDNEDFLIMDKISDNLAIKVINDEAYFYRIIGCLKYYHNDLFGWYYYDNIQLINLPILNMDINELVNYLLNKNIIDFISKGNEIIMSKIENAIVRNINNSFYYENINNKNNILHRYKIALNHLVSNDYFYVLYKLSESIAVKIDWFITLFYIDKKDDPWYYYNNEFIIGESSNHKYEDILYDIKNLSTTAFILKYNNLCFYKKAFLHIEK